MPETVLYAIDASSINQIAYPGVLSSWSKRQCTAFDEALAVELRARSKNLRSQQSEHLFQPKTHCGLGFHRVSSLLQERKRALIDRVLQSGLFACRAMESMLDRAGVNWTLGAAVGLLDAFQSGWWVSSVVEHGLEADRVYYRPVPTRSDLTDNISTWIGVTREARRLCQQEDFQTVGDLTEIRGGQCCWTNWAQEKPYLQNHLRFNPILTGLVTLAIG